MMNTSKIYRTKGPKAAAAIYETALQNLAPKLAALTKITPVIFKLQDHLQVNNIDAKDLFVKYSDQKESLYSIFRS